MNDIFNDKEEKKAQQTKSFKEQILADMKEARRLRKERMAHTESQSEEAQKQGILSSTKLDKDESRKEEARTVMPVPDGKITSQDVDDVLANLDDIFSTEHLDRKKPESHQTVKSQKAPSYQENSSLERENKGPSKKASPPEAWSLATDKKNSKNLSTSTSPDDLEIKVKKRDDWIDDGEAKHWQSVSGSSQPQTANSDQETKEVLLSELTGEKPETDSQPKEEKIVEKTESNKASSKIDDKTQQPLSPPKKEEKDVVAELNRKRQQRYKKTNRLARKISTVLISFIIILLLGTGLFGWYYVSSAIKPVDPKSTKYIQVEIPSGSGNRMIGKILEKAGVIKNAAVFNYYTKFRNYGNLQSGYYNLQKSMSLDEIAKALETGGTTKPQAPVMGKVLIPEGYTIKQISQAITSNANTKKKTDKTPFTAKEFLKTVKDKDFIAKMVKKYPKLLGTLPDASKVTYQLEGYLFPATYSYEKKTSMEDLIDSMLAAMDTNMQSYYDTIKSQGKSVNEILTLASLVEKEGKTDDDRKKIAGVFYNRIDQGMPLQSNIAILYAMGKLGEKTSLKEDTTINTKINSPYNVYTHKGLMPGAVDNPGLSAIKAAIEPESTDNLYFVADVTTGEVYYAKTYEEHSANVEKYVNKKIDKSSSE